MADNDLPPGFSAEPPKPLDIARNYLRDKGNFVNPYAADAIAATWSAESAGDPTAVNPRSKAVGFAQDLGPRKRALLESGDVTPEGQAKYAFQELSSGRYPRSWAALNDKNLSRDQVQKILIDEFEAPGGSAERGYGPAAGDLGRARQYKGDSTPRPSHAFGASPEGAKPSSTLPKGFTSLPPGFSMTKPAPLKQGAVDPSVVARQKIAGTPPPPNHPKWQQLATFLGGLLPGKQELSSPDYLANKLAAAGRMAGSAVDAMLTPTGPLDPLNAIPNREKLVNDIKAWLLEGGNIGGPEGTPGLKGAGKAAEALPASRAAEAGATGEKAVSDALGQPGTGKGTITGTATGRDPSNPLRPENYGAGVIPQPGEAANDAGYEFHAKEVTEALKNAKLIKDIVDGKIDPKDAKQDITKYTIAQIKQNPKKFLDAAQQKLVEANGRLDKAAQDRAIHGQRAGQVPFEEPPRTYSPANENIPQSSGAAATPVGRLAEHNIKTFEEVNKAPSARQRLADGATYMRKYFDASDKAKAIIQKSQGRMQRVGAQAMQAMVSFKKFVGEASIDEQLDLLKWLQDPQAKLSKGLELNEQAQKFVSTFHDWMHTYQKLLEALPQTEKMNFRENYVSQLWRNPKGAMNYIKEYGAKQGSNYFTKARVFDDYEAGIRAGFAPVTTNPVELFSRYIENASKKIASWQAQNEAFDSGMVVYRSPASGGIPDGWVPVKSIPNKMGQTAYAPPGVAKIFDNFASQPAKFNIPGTELDVLAAAQRASIATTALKLSVSGFHPALETMEGIFSGIANGITKIKNGRPVAGLAEVITSPRKPLNSLLGMVPWKPINSYARGRQVQQAYLDGNWGTPEMQRIVRAITDANYDPMREGGLADEYRLSRFPGFIKGWQKGIPITAGGPLKTAVRAFETVMEPTFQYYVPFLKNQAAYDAMKTYLDAHPNITDEEFSAYGRKVANNIDARFGELNKNNIFWNATAKRMAQTAAISWSFTLGQARQAMGFAWDAARVPDKIYSKVKGSLPDTEEIWTDRMSYALAIGLGTAFVDSVYQYMKTGQLPQSGQDLMKPRTGGVDPSTGQPERAALPNFANSYLNIWNNGPLGELYNKTNPLWQTLMQMGTNNDWKNQLIRDPNDTVPKQLEQLGTFAAGNALTPIAIGSVDQAKAGSHISTLERIFGLRAAGMRDTAPEQLKQIISYKTAEAWYEKRKTDVNQQRAKQGLGPLRIKHYERNRLIETYIKNPQSDPLQSYGGTQ